MSGCCSNFQMCDRKCIYMYIYAFHILREGKERGGASWPLVLLIEGICSRDVLNLECYLSCLFFFEVALLTAWSAKHSNWRNM